MNPAVHHIRYCLIYQLKNKCESFYLPGGRNTGLNKLKVTKASIHLQFIGIITG